MIRKHFVEFYSPGTFVSEITTKEIDSWNVEKAKDMANQITERYSAKPYAFRFITRGRNNLELDSKIVANSVFYYINCEVITLEQLKNKKDPNDKILISNMEDNNWNRVVRTKTGWKWTQPLGKNDIVL